MKVEDISHVEEFLNMFKDLLKYKVEVGVFSDSGADIMMIANVNEFGANITVTDKMRNYLHYQGIHLKGSTTSIKIPERSFMRSGYDDQVSKMEKQAESMLGKVLSMDIPPEVFFESLGEMCASSVKKYLVSVNSPKNSSATVKMKGSSNPLVDTGKLRDSITYKVVR